MRILFDSNSLQVSQHLRDNRRLSTLITKLIYDKHTINFSSPKNIEKKELDDTHVLVITTRFPNEYSSFEIQIISEYIEDGGGLLIMSNHADWPSKKLQDFRIHDAKLLSECDLQIEFEQTFFRNKNAKQKTTLSDSHFNQSHPIITGGVFGKSIKSIVTNTSCSIIGSEGDSIVSISNDMVDKRNNLPPIDRSFTHSLEINTTKGSMKSGRIVAIADSGFIGTDGTSNPGPGLIGWGDNLHFLSNSILWLAHELG